MGYKKLRTCKIQILTTMLMQIPKEKRAILGWFLFFFCSGSITLGVKHLSNINYNKIIISKWLNFNYMLIVRENTSPEQHTVQVQYRKSQYDSMIHAACTAEQMIYIHLIPLLFFFFFWITDDLLLERKKGNWKVNWKKETYSSKARICLGQIRPFGITLSFCLIFLFFSSVFYCFLL
jgi:hypothetical protein